MNRLYAYLYDDFLSDKAYERVLAQVETRLSALGIQGRTSRLAIFRSARELVEAVVKDGAQTVVVVGNDRSLQKTMWFLPDLPVTIGYIPVCEPSGIGSILGIPQGEAACDVLAARRIESLDIGTIENRYFFTEVRLEETHAAVQIAGNYRLSPRDGGTICIRNLGGMGAGGRATADPRDGLLDVVIQPTPLEQKNPRLLPWFKKTIPPEPQEETRMLLADAIITSEKPVDVLVDGNRLSGQTFHVSVIPKKIAFITGREKRLDPVRTVGPVTPVTPLSESPITGIVARARQLKDRWRNWYTR